MSTIILKNLHLRRLLLVLCLLRTVSASPQCVATSALSPSTIVNDNSIGDLGFSNPGFASNSDNSRASAAAIASILNGNTYYLKLTGFNFSIPSDAGICGVVVEVEKRAGGLGIGAWIKDNDVRLVKGGVILGDDRADEVSDWPGSDSWFTYGGANDLWNVSLTPADVNSSNFGIAFSARFRGLALVLPAAQIDHVRVTIYYNPTLPTHITAFVSQLRDNTVHLDWTTAQEEDGESVILQRSGPGNSSWTNISRYEMHTSNGGRQYQFRDRLREKGDYAYRLLINNSNGSSHYSETKHIKYAGRNESIYPNPANNFIQINTDVKVNEVVVVNALMQSWKLKSYKTSNGGLRVDIGHLPRGYYYVCFNDQKLSFFKF